MGGGKPADSETAALICRLEETLVLPELRKSATQVAALLADEFAEIGSSGRIYDRDQIIRQLQQEFGEEAPGTVSDFTARELSDGLILVIYRIVEKSYSTKLDLEEDKFRLANDISSGNKVRVNIYGSQQEPEETSSDDVQGSADTADQVGLDVDRA